MRIAQADTDQAPEVAGIVRTSYKRQAEILGLTSIEWPEYVAFETDERMRERIVDSHVAIAYLSDIQPIGTVSCLAGGSGPEIARLAVLPQHRGNDFGRVLMAYAENRLLASGIRHAEVYIVAKFDRLRAYYESMGYVPRSPIRVSALPFEVLPLQKNLSSLSQTAV